MSTVKTDSHCLHLNIELLHYNIELMYKVKTNKEKNIICLTIKH